MSKFPTLETGRLILDQQTAEDAMSVFSMLSDPEVTKYYDLTLHSESEAAALIEDDKQRFNNAKAIRWAIRDKTSGEFIGSGGVNRFEESNHVAVIGYEFCKSAWGKGYATEAIGEIVKFIFSKACPTYINKIEAYVMLGNKASEVILAKYKFQFDGTLREHLRKEDTYHDLKVFSLLRSDQLEELQEAK